MNEVETYLHIEGKTLELLQSDGTHIKLVDVGKTLKSWHCLPLISGLMDKSGPVIVWEVKSVQVYLIDLRQNAIVEMSQNERLKDMAKNTSEKWSWQRREKSVGRWIELKEAWKQYRPESMNTNPMDVTWHAFGERYDNQTDALEALYQNKELQLIIKAMRGI